MNRDEALKLLKGEEQGISEWNLRRTSGEEIPDLHGVGLAGAKLLRANLTGADLREADFTQAHLRKADLGNSCLSVQNLFNADLSRAKLVKADLRRARLYQAEFSSADLRDSDLSQADLRGAKFHLADLRGSVLRDSDLFRVDFVGTQLSRADFRETVATTAFSAVDLSEAVGLAEVVHEGPSNVDIATLFKSGDKIPKAFLRGCGIPDVFLDYFPSLVGSEQPTQFYSCFISHSTKDEEFAKFLHSKMRDQGLRVWFSPEDMQGGKIIHEQIEDAIRDYDKLLLVLSAHSMNSDVGQDGDSQGARAEIKENRELFPIRLVDFATIRDWAFDADAGTDVGLEIRGYFIPDFSNWTDHDSFEKAFSRLLKDLKAEKSAGAGASHPPANPPGKPR